MFSGWLLKQAGIEEPVGLEAAKQKILGEGKEDFQHLARAQLKARAEKKIDDIRNPPDASPTIPSEMPYMVQRGEKKGQPVELKAKTPAKREKEYFNLALKRRDQLEKKPRGLDAMPKASKKKSPANVSNETPLDALSKLPKSVNTDPDNKRPDVAGRSVGVNRNENAVIEAIHLMNGEGMIDGDELREALQKHYEFQDASGGGIGDPYDDRRASSAIESAINTAKLMLQHFDNGMPKPITGGVFGSQFTDVPDENRSGLYDYLMSNLSTTLGRNRLGQRRAGARRDYNDEEYRKEGNKILKELVLDDRDSKAKPKDLFTPADVYLSNAETEARTIQDFELIQKLFESGDIDENQLLKSFTHMLQKKHQQRDLVGYSLKELDKESKGKLTEANTAADDFTTAISSVINGDVQLPMSFNPKTERGETRLTAGRNFKFNLLLKIMQDGQESDMGDIEFASSSAVRPSKFKIEPFGAKPTRGSRQKLGETPIDMIRNLVKQYAGEDLDDNINYVKGDGRDTILQSDNYSDEQIGQWREFVEDLVQNPSRRFDINKSNIGINGEQMAPGDFIEKILQNFNFSDEERNSNERYVDRGGQPYDRVESRFDTHSMLRNLRIFKALRNADNDGKLHDLLGGFIFNAQRLNTSEDSPFFPFAKIAN